MGAERLWYCTFQSFRAQVHTLADQGRGGALPAGYRRLGRWTKRKKRIEENIGATTRTGTKNILKKKKYRRRPAPLVTLFRVLFFIFFPGGARPRGLGDDSVLRRASTRVRRGARSIRVISLESMQNRFFQSHAPPHRPYSCGDLGTRRV